MATMGQPPPGGRGNDEDDDPSRKRKLDGTEDDNPRGSKRSKRASKPPDVQTALRENFSILPRARIRQIILQMRQQYTVYKYVLADPSKKDDKGKQAASTIGPKSCGFKTGQGRGLENMHSELVCVNSQLNSSTWQIPVTGTQSGQIVGDGNLPVPSGDFKTVEPHCGVCSIFLFLLNLPLGKPCVGKPNLGHQSYPLPDQMKRSVAFLVKLLGSLDLLKRMIGTMLGLGSDPFILVSGYADPLAGQEQDLPVVLWTAFCASNNLKVLWDFIKEIIFEVTAGESRKEDVYKSPFGS